MRQFLTGIGVLLTLSAEAQVSSTTVDELLHKIRAELPKGWHASYESEFRWLQIARDTPVTGTSIIPNASGHEKPEPQEFAYCFRVSPALGTAEYWQLHAENMQTQHKANALYDKLVGQRLQRRFDSFVGRTAEEKADIARYNLLKKSRHSLPHFYFGNISLEWQISSPDAPAIHIEDEGVRAECEGVAQRIVHLLSTYSEAETQ